MIYLIQLVNVVNRTPGKERKKICNMLYKFKIF